VAGTMRVFAVPSGRFSSVATCSWSSLAKGEVQRLTLSSREVRQLPVTWSEAPSRFQARAVIRKTGHMQIIRVRFKLRLTAAPAQLVEDTVGDPRTQGRRPRAGSKVAARRQIVRKDVLNDLFSCRTSRVRGP
jgi:hypothetical protein